MESNARSVSFESVIDARSQLSINFSLDNDRGGLECPKRPGTKIKNGPSIASTILFDYSQKTQLSQILVLFSLGYLFTANVSALQVTLQ